MPPDRADIAGSARWHFFAFDRPAGTATLLRLDESHYRQASFLDERILRTAPEQIAVPIEDFAAALGSAPPAPSANFIFHIGHCGSTLLSRALDASPGTLPLREPLTLRLLAAPEFTEPDALLPLTLRAHERGFRRGQTALIKATSICNPMIPRILDCRPQARAVLVYVDLETFLAGMLGKQTPVRDLRGHLTARLADWSMMDGAPGLQPDALSEAQLAVLAWLTGFRHLLEANRQYGARTRLFDFESLLAAPESELTAIAGWLGLKADVPALLAAWPEVSTGYSKKPDEPYSAFNRRKTLQRGRLERGREIREGLRWARTLAGQVEALAGCMQHFGTRA